MINTKKSYSEIIQKIRDLLINNFRKIIFLQLYLNSTEIFTVSHPYILPAFMHQQCITYIRNAQRHQIALMIMPSAQRQKRSLRGDEQQGLDYR